ncbi:hypothetical protein NC652_025404 [Populus alba x Populus x berolinensis]|nr:hypothetical protein NC652_025404 [Populus alba x Populus x berolinensis]
MVLEKISGRGWRMCSDMTGGCVNFPEAKYAFKLRNRYAQKLGHKRGVAVLDATEWVAVSHMNASIKARKEFACVSSLLLWPLRKGAVCGGLDRLFDPIPFSVSQRPFTRMAYHFRLSLFSSLFGLSSSSLGWCARYSLWVDRMARPLRLYLIFLISPLYHKLI